MIRIFTIFCKLNQITYSDRQWVEKDLEKAALCAKECPHCHAERSMTFFARYGRCIVGYHNGRPVEYMMSIPRYRCNVCRHTHAMLSAVLVPRRTFSLRFILRVLQCYFLEHKTVTQICNHFCISSATLYRWKKIFLRQRDVFYEVLEEIWQSNQFIFGEVDGMQLKSFYDAFHFSFMEKPPLQVEWARSIDST